LEKQEIFSICCDCEVSLFLKPLHCISFLIKPALLRKEVEAEVNNEEGKQYCYINKKDDFIILV
jgi:hypothetical protein